MTTEELRESLLASPKNGYNLLTAEQKAEMESYCKGYMAFIDTCKTEREATTWAVVTAEAHGFKEMKPGMELQPGDKVYYNNRGKAIILAVIGSESLNWGANICAAHVDGFQISGLLYAVLTAILINTIVAFTGNMRR